jgi:hypothetical protein
METTTAVHTEYRTERHLPSAEQGAGWVSDLMKELSF